MQLDRFSLRHLIYQMCPGGSDLEAFLIDFFPDVAQQVAPNMTRVAMVTELFLRHQETVVADSIGQLVASKSITSSRRNLRNRIFSIFKSQADLTAFLTDHFQSVCQRLSTGMSTTDQVNQLLLCAEEQDIEQALSRIRASSIVTEAQPVGSSHPGKFSSPQTTTSGDRIVHQHRLGREVKVFDVIEWEQPYPERFKLLTSNTARAQKRKFKLTREKYGLCIESFPHLLDGNKAVVRDAEVQLRSDEDRIDKTYYYPPEGKLTGPHYLLSVIRELDLGETRRANTGWRWQIELADTTSLPHLYLQFLWSE